MHAFSSSASGSSTLAAYRRAVLDEDLGPCLEELPRTLGLGIQGRTYKRVPSGQPLEHPRADWLRHSGLFAQIEQPIPPELYPPVLADFCMASYTRLAPLQEWLVELLPA